MILQTCFQQNLQSAMDDLHWNQSDLAREMGVDPQYVRKYLKGITCPGLDVVERFSKALGLQHPCELLNPIDDDRESTSRICAVCENPVAELFLCQSCDALARKDLETLERNDLLDLFVLDQWSKCSPLSRILLLSIRSTVGAGGFFPERPALIKSMLLPEDACDVVHLLDELEDRGLIRRWTADEYFEFIHERKPNSEGERDESICLLPGLDEYMPCERFFRVIREPANERTPAVSTPMKSGVY
ncbi:helix-turn-helix domain-containing protein [Planctomicrobium sp. SH661]|uniref:helix-turn-helix domain-containing protein n=1 Tax=Planctomicrobium sp. SH661 TaxID=3448124 RepID=UPI003F5C35F8